MVEEWKGDLRWDFFYYYTEEVIREGKKGELMGSVMVRGCRDMVGLSERRRRGR